MKFGLRILFVCAALAAAAWSQEDAAGLERVLSGMDASAKNFHTAAANFTGDQYTKVVDETETQKGKLYFQRHGNDVDMAADFSEPRQYAIYSNGKAQVYNPKTDMVNEYRTGKNREQVEAFLLLGFGGSGHALLNTYDVKYLGMEKANGANAAKLELIPKSRQLQNNMSRILLWIDPARGVSVQQQMFFPGGDYRLAKYSDIQINQKLPDSAFKLKTTPKTKIVSPQE
jgi:outer membrane lipoprotein-sorting protein